MKQSEVIEAAEKKSDLILERQCASFTKGLLIVGLPLLVATIIGECIGKEFSWKIYYLATVILGIYAAANGLVVHLKAGQNEIKIYKPITDACEGDK